MIFMLINPMATFQFLHYLIPQQPLTQLVTPSTVNILLVSRLLHFQLSFFFIGHIFYSYLMFPLHLSNNLWMLKYPKVQSLCIFYILSNSLPSSLCYNWCPNIAWTSPLNPRPNYTHMSTWMSNRHFNLCPKLSFSSLISFQTAPPMSIKGNCILVVVQRKPFTKFSQTTHI